MPLAREARRLVCSRGHSFDIARSGYVNLLQPQDRRSRDPGDSAEAVAARRRLFERGIGAPIDEAIRSLVRGDALLDAGCGEGHILGMLPGQRAGVDISLPAIEAAAKRYRDVEWIVANADRFLPFAPASFDCVLSITARLNPSEFRRVVRDDGSLLVAIAGPDDLVELRGHSRDRVERTVSLFAPHFALERHERVELRAEVDREALHDLAVSTYRPRRMKEIDAVTLSRDLLLFRPS